MEDKNIEISKILREKPIKNSNVPKSIFMVAISRPSESESDFEVYLENLDLWVKLPIANVKHVEQVDVVEINNEQCKIVNLEIELTQTCSGYQLLLQDALNALSNFITESDKQSCNCDDEHVNTNNKVYKQAGRRLAKSGNCTYCKFIGGRWRCWTNPWCS